MQTLRTATLSSSPSALPPFERSEIKKSESTPKGEKRKQVEVRNLTRGDKKKALAIAGDHDLLRGALADYEKDWRSAGDTSDFNIKTWVDVHNEVDWRKFGLPADLKPTPLTPLKIAVVGSAMKGGGYRSCKNYMDAIKRTHTDEGFAWNEQLALASKRFHASTSRGMGPARQSAPLNFMKLREMDVNAAVKNSAYPARPGSAAVMATFWLLRDLEATNAEFRDMSFDVAAKRVTLMLSMSKNDPRALGCERIWGCVCEGEGNPAGCPYHAALDIKKFIETAFPHDSLAPGFPLFPTPTGEAVTSENMLAFIEELAQMMDEDLYTKAGQRRFGKHSWRATGAVHLSTIGLDTFKIQLIGRWLCAIVLRYCRLAPISDIARDYKVATHAGKAGEALKIATAMNKKVTAQIAEMVDKCADESKKLYEIIRQVETRCAPRTYIVNRKTNKVHKVLTHLSDVGDEAIAYCGFKYAKASVLMKAQLPAAKRDHYCSTCLAEVRANMCK